MNGSLEKPAEYSSALVLEDFPEETRLHAIRVIRDTFGVMLAGAALPEIKGMVHQRGPDGGSGQSTLMGVQQAHPAYYAALVNGTAGVSLELDEGNQFAVNHPAVHILPAAFALAEELGASGTDLLTAFIAGYEIAVRAGRAAKLRDPVHPFGTAMIVGTACAAARLLSFDTGQVIQAMNLAAGMTIASSQSAANSGASVRNLATGLTNHNGLLAARLVQAGFMGEPRAMEVVFGEILGRAFETQNAWEDLGDRYYITQNYFKKHACSRWNHAPIEAVKKIQQGTSLKSEDIAGIIVWTFDPATRLDWKSPSNGYAAKHSIPFNVAARILYGTNDLSIYTDEAVNEPALQDLAQRIEVREDPALTALLPDLRPARVEIKLHGGGVLKEVIEQPPGGFDAPYSDSFLEEKFLRLGKMTLPEKNLERIIERIHGLSSLSDIRVLGPLFRGETA